MIPKIIHYFWFGNGTKDRISQACIKTFNSAFNAEKILEWNESNCNLKENKFVEDALKLRKWAYVSDYFRMKALYEWGGCILILM